METRRLAASHASLVCVICTSLGGVWCSGALPCSLTTSVKDTRHPPAGGEPPSARTTEEVRTQAALTQRASVRLRGLSGASSWRLRSVSASQTSPRPPPPPWKETQDSRLRNGGAGRARLGKGCVTNVREAQIRLLMFLKSNRFDKIIH